MGAPAGPAARGRLGQLELEFRGCKGTQFRAMTVPGPVIRPAGGGRRGRNGSESRRRRTCLNLSVRVPGSGTQAPSPFRRGLALS
jgi:hypothetical protein